LSGKEVRQIDNDQQFFGGAISPDGKVLAPGTHQRIELWGAGTGDEVPLLGGGQKLLYPVQGVSPDGKTLDSPRPRATDTLWEVASGKERGQVRVEAGPGAADPRFFRRFGGEGDNVTTLAFAADGRTLAVGCSDHAVRLCDLARGEELQPLAGHAAPLASAVFTPDGKQLVTFDMEGLRLTWDGRRVTRPPAGSLVLLSDAEFAELWSDLCTGAAFRVYRAVRYLTSDPGRTLPLLSGHVKPVPAGDAQRIAQLIGDLQSPSAAVRRKAMMELRTHGEAAYGALSLVPEDQRRGPNQAAAMLLQQMKVEDPIGD